MQNHGHWGMKECIHEHNTPAIKNIYERPYSKQNTKYKKAKLPKAVVSSTITTMITRDNNYSDLTKRGAIFIHFDFWQLISMYKFLDSLGALDLVEHHRLFVHQNFLLEQQRFIHLIRIST